MYQLVLLDPFVGSRLGVVRQCIECRAALGADAPDCPGYGPGCLVRPEADRRSREVLPEKARALR